MATPAPSSVAETARTAVEAAGAVADSATKAPLDTAGALLEWFSQYGVAVVIVAVLMAFGIMFGVIWLRRYAKQGEVETHDKPGEHPFFVEAENWISRTRTLRFKNEFRTLVIRDYQQILWKRLRDCLEKFAKDDPNSLTPAKFANQLRETLSAGYDEALREFKQEGIPEVMIEKFDSALRVPLQLLFNAAEQISDDKSLSVNTQRLWLFLSLMEAFLETMGSEFVLIMNKINGEFDGLEYKGVKHIKHGTLDSFPSLPGTSPQGNTQ